MRLAPDAGDGGAGHGVARRVLRPETNVTAYLTTMVQVPKRDAGGGARGLGGAIKVWVDGALAVDHDVYRPVRIDQDAAPVRAARRVEPRDGQAVRRSTRPWSVVRAADRARRRAAARG